MARHTLLSMLLLLPLSLIAGDSVWVKQVELQIAEASAQFRDAGYRKLGETWIDELEAEDDMYVTVRLNPDYDYIAIGVCDADCGDLDLILYDENDNPIARDIGSDDVPVLSGSPDYSGTYYLEAVMVDCRAATCAFGVALYAR